MDIALWLQEFIIFKVMDYTFLLMRHAYSLHNIEKDTWKKQYPDKSYKQKEEYRRSKFNPALIDPFYIDQAQC